MPAPHVLVFENLRSKVGLDVATHNVCLGNDGTQRPEVLMLGPPSLMQRLLACIVSRHYDMPPFVLKRMNT